MTSLNQGVEILSRTSKTLPNNPGIYQMLGKNNEMLYIGKAKNLKKRVSSYINYAKLPYRLKNMISQIKKIEIIQTTSEIEALILELHLIKTKKPKYNILLTDDKSFPYIYFNIKHDFPGIFSTRNKNLKGKYFGPYTGAYDVAHTLDTLKKSFLIRSCSDSDFASRTRPCLEYQIKRCSAPCVDYISKKEYKNLIKQSFDFLEGKNKEVRKNLVNEMELASKNLEYEKAAKLRDRIKALSLIEAKQAINNDLDNSDVIFVNKESEQAIIEIFFFRNGLNHGNLKYYPKNTEDASKQEILTEFVKQFYNPENLVAEIITNVDILEKENLEKTFLKSYKKKTKFINPKSGKKKEILELVRKNANYNLDKKILENNLKFHKKLKEILDLDKIPERIELFDNSHISGTNQVGAMVVSGLKGFEKNLYRKYNIKSNITGGDDYAMLEEVLTRRYSRLKKEDPSNENNSWPGLILIDGGKGQATITHKVLSQLNLNIPFLCIAKGVERNKGKERFCNFDTDYFNITDKEALFYLQRIRDEVHNFVINAHRKKREKSLSKSELDQIKGIGSKRKKTLLNYFGSVATIKSLSAKDLTKAPGISLKLAQIIKSQLN